MVYICDECSRLCNEIFDEEKKRAMLHSINQAEWHKETEMMTLKERTYLCIDLKSFYASVEYVERGLDPMTTNLVVADASRAEKPSALLYPPSLMFMCGRVTHKNLIDIPLLFRKSKNR